MDGWTKTSLKMSKGKKGTNVQRNFESLENR